MNESNNETVFRKGKAQSSILLKLQSHSNWSIPLNQLLLFLSFLYTLLWFSASSEYRIWIVVSSYYFWVFSYLNVQIKSQ